MLNTQSVTRNQVFAESGTPCKGGTILGNPRLHRGRDGKGETEGGKKGGGRRGEEKGEASPFPFPFPSPVDPLLLFPPAPSLSLSFPSPLKPWVSEDGVERKSTGEFFYNIPEPGKFQQGEQNNNNNNNRVELQANHLWRGFQRNVLESSFTREQPRLASRRRGGTTPIHRLYRYVPWDRVCF